MAWRSLLKKKVSSFINLTGLAVGLATSILILLDVAEEFRYDKFNVHLKDIYLLMKNQKQMDGISTGENTAGPMAASLRNEMPETKYASRVAPFSNQLLKVGDKVFYESGIYAEPDLFNIMSFRAVAGNPVQALTSQNGVVLTEHRAKELFGKENPMGRLVLLNNKNVFTVEAVIKDIPTASTLQFDMVIPFAVFARDNDWLNKWDDNRIQNWVLLKPNSNLKSLNARLTRLLQTRSNDSSASLFLYPLANLRLHGGFSNGKPVGGKIDAVKLMAALGLFVILIACINFMNIATARSEDRAREVGVRKVLGASRQKIMYQFLSEAMLVTFLALLGGVVLARTVLPAFNQLAEKTLQFNFWDWRIWAILLFMGIFTGLVAGLYPAFFLSRFRIINVLKGRLAEGRRGAGLRKALVTFQFFISIIFIVGTILVYEQINYVRNRPLGYEQENLIDIRTSGELASHFPLFKNEMDKIEGVKSATAGSDNILQYGGSVTGMNYPGKSPGQEISVIVSSVQYDWIRTAGIQLVEGRDFSPAWLTDTQACLINESAVRKMGLQEPVIGTKIGNGTVIGVFKDFVFNNPSGIIAPMVVSLNTGNLGHILVRIQSDLHWRETLAKIERAAKKINPDFPFEFSFLQADYQQRFEEWSFYGVLAAVIGGIAIVIACLGLFGLSSFLAEQRSREMSIRKVFGASAGKVWFLLSRDFLKPVLIALLIVIPLSAVVAQKFLSNIVYHTPLAWWMFALAASLTVLIALFTVGYQGIRTALENPAKRLRSE